jgi:peroxiredoxin
MRSTKFITSFLFVFNLLAVSYAWASPVYNATNDCFAESGYFNATKSNTTLVADSCVIEVFATNLGAAKVRLVGTYGDQNYLADSTLSDASGHFVLRRQKPLLSGYYYFLTSSGKNFAFLLDDNEQFITMRLDITNTLGTLEVTGSKSTELFYQNLRYQATQDPELSKIGEALKTAAPGTPDFVKAKARQDEIIKDRKKNIEETAKQYPKALYSKFKLAGQNPDFIEFRKPNGTIDTLRQVVSYRSRFWDGVDFTDERLLRTPVIVNKLRRYIKELTPQNPDSIISVADPLIKRVLPHKPYFTFFANWIAGQYENTKTTVMDGEAVFVHIIKNYFTPQYATWDTPENLDKLQKKVSEMEASLLNRKGPDVRAKDQNGIERSIYEKTAPIIVVFMFSPDCEHCQKDADEIQRIYAAWKDKGVDFYGISVNTTDAEWKKFIADHKFTFTNVFDPTNRAIYGKYYVDITPELYILNKDRTIVAKNLHANQLEEIFNRELKKLR